MTIDNAQFKIDFVVRSGGFNSFSKREIKMLIDEFLPRWDVRERHHIKINAPAPIVSAAARRMDLRGSYLTNLLFKMRGIPASAEFALDDLLKMNFVLLGETEGKELLLGLTGKFWQPSGDLVRIAPDRFVQFNEPGYAKAVWNFSLDEITNGAVRLNTETRVLCTDAASRRRFRLYWFFIGAFSSLIRREMLSAIKSAAESNCRMKKSL